MHNENTYHRSSEFHHHHHHAGTSKHISGAHILQIEGLNLSYVKADKKHKLSLKQTPSREQILQDINLSVHANEVIALLGESGSGKTSIAKCITSTYSKERSDPFSGEMYFCGRSVDLSNPNINEQILYIPQGISALDPKYKYSTENDSKEDLLPKEMSGGMAKKALIKHAFAMKKSDIKLIIADEPTDGLDMQSSKNVMDLLRSKINDSAGMILITHDINIALEYADRIAIMKDGHIAEETSVDSFKKGDLDSYFAKKIHESMPKNWNIDKSLTKNTICIFGDTGVGKSTIAKIICGYEKGALPDKLCEMFSDISKDKCEMVFQDPYLSFPPNSFIKVSLDQAMYDKCNTLEMLKIETEWMDRYPHELSGGQLQKLAIYKTLMTKPTCLVADEATSMCDCVTQKEIYIALLKWCRENDCKLIFITHDTHIKDKIADRCIYLNKLQD